jgi:hypothetical protein
MKTKIRKYDYSKCYLVEKKLLDNQICLYQCVWNENCSITQTKCKAIIN